MGQDLIGKPFKDVEKIFLENDNAIEFDESGLISYKYGIGIYAPFAKKVPLEKVEGVIVFEKGYEKGITKLTLERTPDGKWMDDLGLYKENASRRVKYEELGLTRQQADECWRTVSSRYADGTSGSVTAFAKNVPDVIKPKTIFWSTELPQLRSNSNVTHINIR